MLIGQTKDKKKESLILNFDLTMNLKPWIFVLKYTIESIYIIIINLAQ